MKAEHKPDHTSFCNTDRFHWRCWSSLELEISRILSCSLSIPLFWSWSIKLQSWRYTLHRRLLAVLSAWKPGHRSRTLKQNWHRTTTSTVTSAQDGVIDCKSNVSCLQDLVASSGQGHVWHANHSVKACRLVSIFLTRLALFRLHYRAVLR